MNLTDSNFTKLSAEQSRLLKTEKLQVAHVTFELDQSACTFSLKAGEAVHAKDRRALFSGHITPEMGLQLRQLAEAVEDIRQHRLEAKE